MGASGSNGGKGGNGGNGGNGGIVKSAGRALAVLEYFDEVQRAMSATDIRARLNMPASSATALLRSLVELGYLHYDARRRTYMPTLRVGLLGDWMNARSHGSRQLCAMLESLSRGTGQVVALGARCNLHAQYIHVVNGRGAKRLLKRGSLAPLTRTAVGWVLLSRLPDREVTRICMRLNAEEAPERRVSPSWLIDRIHAVREDGYAYCFGGMREDVGAIGMAVPAAYDRPPMAFAVTGVGQAFAARKDEFVGAMHDRVARYMSALEVAPAAPQLRLHGSVAAPPAY